MIFNSSYCKGEALPRLFLLLLLFTLQRPNYKNLSD